MLENWVNKTTNLLVEEFDAGPGTRVVLDLPVHWRTVVWALAAWRVGTTVVLTPADDATPGDSTTRPDVVVTTSPDRWAVTRADLVAVALPALARRFDGDLPAGAIDAASAVMTYGDQVGWVPEPDLALDALVGTGSDRVGHAALVPAPGGEPPRRVLVDGRAGPARTLRALLSAYAANGSVVLLSPRTAAALDDDRARRARVTADERVDATAP